VNKTADTVSNAVNHQRRRMIAAGCQPATRYKDSSRDMQRLSADKPAMSPTLMPTRNSASLVGTRSAMSFSLPACQQGGTYPVVNA